ncbi:RNA polymerase sigma-70 factor [Persicitalea sp.]|uniref:RNA polymerase sigma-70 factor n=1 Tax=Persicitalea sp. TaxID=3100273 RepID=UPI0035940C2F
MSQPENIQSDLPFRENLPLLQHGGLNSPAQPLVESDEIFLKRAIDACPDKGIELLYRRYFQPLCSHAIKYVGSKTVAEDLVSEVFYEFYRNASYTHITTSYRFYLFRAVRNRAFNHVQGNLRKAEILADLYDTNASHSESPEAISQFEELYQDVQNAVNSLPISRRRIYMMNRFEGKKYQEIATELDISVKTVEVQLYRANKFIRTLLRSKWLPFLLLSILT